MYGGITMPFPEIQQEWVGSVQSSLGIITPKQQEEFRSFLFSAYAKYEQFLPTYIRRNLAFMSDTVLHNVSRSTNPANNPSGFGLGLGSFIGLLLKAEDPYVCQAMFADHTSYKNIMKCVEILKGINGFDISVIREIAQHMNASALDQDELERYNAFVQSI
jgi:hypothetical protein